MKRHLQFTSLFTAVTIVLLLSEVSWAGLEFSMSGPTLVLQRGAPISSPPTVGESLHIKCGFTAKGTAGGRPAPVRFQIRVDGKMIKNVVVPVTLNQTVFVGESWIPGSAGAHPISCEVNPDKASIETTYADNRVDTTVTVLSVAAGQRATMSPVPVTGRPAADTGSGSTKGKGAPASPWANAAPAIAFDAVAKQMKSQGKSAQEVATYLHSQLSANANQVGSALLAAGYTFGDTASALKKVFNLSAQQVALVLKAAGATAEQIAGALKTAFGLTAQQVAAVLKAGGFTAEQVGAALKVAYGLAAQQAGQLLRDLGFTPTEVGGVLIHTYKLGEKVGGVLIHTYKLGEKEFFTVFKTLWNDLEPALNAYFDFMDKPDPGKLLLLLPGVGWNLPDAAALIAKRMQLDAQHLMAIMREAGFFGEVAMNVAQKVFKLGAKEAAAALKAGGYTALAISQGLAKVYGLSAQQAAATLQVIGYGAKEITEGLRLGYNLGADATGAALKALGYSAQEAGAALRDAYGLGAKATATALKAAGYAAKEVAGVLKDVFGLSGNAAKGILEGAGYALGEVGDFFGL